MDKSCPWPILNYLQFPYGEERGGSLKEKTKSTNYRKFKIKNQFLELVEKYKDI